MATAARGAAIVLGGAGVSFVAAYAGTQLLSKPSAPRAYPTERERRDTFEEKAPKWDSTVRWDEFVTGISRQRRRLLQLARGDVLEVGVGTGRNFSYYVQSKISSVTVIDFSRAMLEVAGGKREELGSIPLRLKLATAQKMDFPDHSFDTVVDTFGICSFEAPVESLREMRRVLKEDGQILLLEHGASNWELVQGLLNGGSQRHVEKYGCYCNRNIVALVQAAGLYVAREERQHFGTTYFLVCRRSSMDEE
mmetsp:Transcript_107712/g.214038  ORF Transcript_107712/g.214038 Transcript_107712/m.214038 type:complete len:251 (-) Transcript_107712:65-817(-)